MGISAGRLDRRITLQRYTATKDDYGHDNVTYPDIATVWASVIYGTGAERREAAQKAGSIAATFGVRKNSITSTLTVRDRISYDGGFWDIASIVPTLDRNVGFDITATRADD